MKRFLVNSVLVILLFGSGAATHKAYQHFHHPLKHTWDCQLVSRPTEHVFWFARPNREIFEMYLDNPPAILMPGQIFRDVAYTDDNEDMRHFVKATLK
jgi:hypothetical protein